MNGAFLHLALNHVPVIGVPIAFLLLAAGLIRKSRDLVLAGYVTLIAIGLGAYPVVKTGGMAAHIIRDLPGVTRATIHDHAEAADFGFYGCLILGVLSIFGFGLTTKRQNIPRGLTWVTLIGTLWLSTVMIRVAHLGGLIRHPEVARDFVIPSETATTAPPTPPMKSK